MQISPTPHPFRRNGIATTLIAAISSATLLFASPASAQTFSIDTSVVSPLTGLWWNPNESGWGATITQQSNIMFVTMFVYDSVGNPVWYTVSCGIVGASCSGDMLKVKGGVSPTSSWSGIGVSASKVGTMTVNFAGNDNGSMSYILDGQAGSKQITRQGFGLPPLSQPRLAGQWQGAIIEARTNCTQSQSNGNRATYGQYDIGMDAGAAGSMAIALAGVTGLHCIYSGSFTTNGARLIAEGTLSCIDGKRGRWRSTQMNVTAKSMSLELAVQLDTTETCTIAAILGGSRQ